MSYYCATALYDPAGWPAGLPLLKVSPSTRLARCAVARGVTLAQMRDEFALDSAENAPLPETTRILFGYIGENCEQLVADMCQRGMLRRRRRRVNNRCRLLIVHGGAHHIELGSRDELRAAASRLHRRGACSASTRRSAPRGTRALGRHPRLRVRPVRWWRALRGLLLSLLARQLAIAARIVAGWRRQHAMLVGLGARRRPGVVVRELALVAVATAIGRKVEPASRRLGRLERARSVLCRRLAAFHRVQERIT